MKTRPSTATKHLPEAQLGGSHKAAIKPGISTGSNWDSWPDGTMNRDFTWEEFKAAGQLMCHWATKVGGGDRSGNALAEVWERGKKSTRSCLGVIVCDDEDCEYTVRPLTTRSKLVQQLEKNCDICGASLIHQACDVRAVLWKWSDGVHYEQNGSHHHERPPRVLHLSKTERQRFEQLVEQHPKTGP